MNMVPGPSNDMIFRSGFELAKRRSARASTTPSINWSRTIRLEALDLATGSYHTWSAFLHNINLYDDGTGLQVYWYNDQITGAYKTKVGGVYDSATSGYAVLHSANRRTGFNVQPHRHTDEEKRNPASTDTSASLS